MSRLKWRFYILQVNQYMFDLLIHMPYNVSEYSNFDRPFVLRNNKEL